MPGTERWKAVATFDPRDRASYVALLRELSPDIRRTRYDLSVALDVVGRRVSFLIRRLKRCGWPIRGTMRNGYLCSMSDAQREWVNDVFDTMRND